MLESVINMSVMLTAECLSRNLSLHYWQTRRWYGTRKPHGVSSIFRCQLQQLEVLALRTILNSRIIVLSMTEHAEKFEVLNVVTKE